MWPCVLWKACILAIQTHAFDMACDNLSGLSWLNLYRLMTSQTIRQHCVNETSLQLCTVLSADEDGEENGDDGDTQKVDPHKKAARVARELEKASFLSLLLVAPLWAASGVCWCSDQTEAHHPHQRPH